MERFYPKPFVQRDAHRLPSGLRLPLSARCKPSSDITAVFVRCHVLFVLVGVPHCFEVYDEAIVDDLPQVELWVVGLIEEFGQTCDRGQFGG